MSENSKKMVIPNGDYYIGLDIGTNSVGWALTDREYNVLKFNDKTTWGVRLFDEAKTAKDRRLKRSLRRRLHRRRVRLNYLKELFRPEIEKIDPDFFKRLQNSYLYVNDDKQSGTRVDFAKENNIKLYSKSKRLRLFEGNGITDKQYYKDFPTIYHLQTALINGGIPILSLNENGKYELHYEKPVYNLYDPRLVFFALYSLLKARGSFLYDIDSNSYKEGSDFEINLKDVAKFLSLKFDDNIDFNLLKDLFKNRREKTIKDGEQFKKIQITSINDKHREFENLVKIDDNGSGIEWFDERKNIFYKIARLALGGQNTFESDKENEDSLLYGLNEKIKLSFGDEKYEENLEKIRNVSEETAKAIEHAYKIYVWSKLSEILKEQPYICMGKLVLYQKHKNDLHYLKNVIREILKDDVDKAEKFKKIFDEQKGETSYETYIHHREKKNGDTWLQAFEDYIDKITDKRFQEYKKNDEYLKSEFENGTFLPVLRSLYNLVIPNAIVKDEYREILDVAKSSGLGFLEGEDQSRFKDDGSNKTTYDKVLSLVSFKLPYYVGPLAYEDDESLNKWVVRKEEYKNKEIMPWILSDAIDEAETRKAFIQRLVSNCAYLQGCKVLPKNSIILQKQQVLEELNNLKVTVNGIHLNNDEAIKLKQYLFENVFKEVKTPTKKRVKIAIINYFRDKGDYISEKDVDFKLGGEDDTKFNSSYSSYVELKDFKLLSDEQKEELIKLYAIFGNETDVARKEAETAPEFAFYQMLSTSDKSKIHKALSNMKGWGRYSREYLEELKVKDPKTGISQTILDWLYNTNYNIMYLMNMKETEENFSDIVRKFNSASTTKKNFMALKYSDIDELYVSPMTKRSIWQSVRIVKELVKTVGYPPKKIFIETTRSNGEKGKTVKSRYNILNEKYEAVLKQKKDITEELSSLDVNLKDLQSQLNERKISQNINGDRLYLYFMQCGKDMYTGEDISLNDVLNGTLYDTDHIYPRSLTNDDSIIENKVLVSKTMNGNKNNITLKSSGVIKNKDKVIQLWKYLKEKKFISDEKYRRLMYSLSHECFEDIELDGFKNRQLSATSWITKTVMNLFQQCSFSNSKSISAERAIKSQNPEIVSVKASLVSEFRNKYMMYKSRDISDIHHAKDAYLNIVVGNVYNTEFTHKFWKDVSQNIDDENSSYNLTTKIYDRNIIGDENSIAWIKGKTIITVENVMNKNDALLTRMQTIGKGELFDATVYSQIRMPIKKENINSVLPIKKGDFHYGYYNKQSSSFFALVKSFDKKNKPQLTIECVPIWFYNKNKALKMIEIVRKYCELPKTLGGLEMKTVDVLIPYVRINSLIKFEGNGFIQGYVSGRTGKNLIFNVADMLDLGEMENYAVQVCRFIQKQVKNKELTIAQFNYRVPLDDKSEQQKLRRDERRPIITTTMNITLYEKLIEIHKEPQFINKPSSQLSKLLEPQKENFALLSIEDQVYVLFQFIQYLNGELGDFRLLGGVEKGGCFTISNNINEYISIINQSVTGLYENSVTISLDDIKDKEDNDGQ